jgi:7,8-dihydropterin-6-yl-methyl-4-(beta-D-ribofuranosyl)aminobenzene 5'-phosphate synthase
MYAKVIYDNKSRRGLASGWGFSCLLDGKILFDTGDSAESLLNNMGRLMVAPKDIEGVVISHDHWDHTGGLWEILRSKKGLKVYACRSFSEEFKSSVKELGGKLIFVDKPTEIADNIFLAGAVETEYKGMPISEQALIIKGEKGVSVITGCAHPGVVEMINTVKSRLKVKSIYMTFGGFHLGGVDREGIDEVINQLKKLGVKKVGPAHCSGEKARRIFRGKYHDNFIPVKAGEIIQL